MPAFYDARCPRWGRRVGWFGELKDRPACRCGHRPPDSELQADQQEMDAFRQLLAELQWADPAWDKCLKARVAAGLTLRQAAKLLEVAPETLAQIERGEGRPSQALAEWMAHCSGG